jgi:alginate O-acetyltransferase complex protein AlgI
MLFTSPEFAVLLVATFAAYYLCRAAAAQVGVLLAASLIFYAWSEPWLTILLLLSATITNTTAFRIQRKGLSPAARRRAAAIGVSANLGTLALFKYGGLLGQGMASVFPATRSLAEQLVLIPLPIGISFYTFHGISMIVDSLRNDAGAEPPAGMGRRDPGGFAGFWSRGLLYVVFFPQLVAGPIVRSKEFMPQIGLKRFGDVPWRCAFEQCLLGFFLKQVIADNLHNQTFWIRSPYFADLGAERAWVLVVAYSIQIFADFAGYSLIAIGTASLFGYRLPANFDFPYLSASIAEFWRRWHISLSTWLRDYLYLPLGGNRRGAGRTYFNLLVVMGLGGLWHGASVSYLAWGVYHGLLLVGERVLAGAGPGRRSAPRGPMRWVRTFLVFLLVSLGWVFFQLPAFEDALAFTRLLFTRWTFRFPAWDFAIVALYALPVVAWHFLHLTGHHRRVPWLRACLIAGMLFLLLTNRGTSNAFIYFQF